MRAVRKPIKVKIDKEDEYLLKKYTWSIQSKGYAMTTLNDEKKSALLMHRVIINAPKGVYVDHINGDPLDNRRANLRLCTIAQNNGNTPKRKANTLGNKGIFTHPNTPKYVAAIQHNYKSYYLGSYVTKEMAALAYNRAALHLFGEFARLNKLPWKHRNLSLDPSQERKLPTH